MMMSMDGSMLITGKILMPHMRSPVATKMTPPQAVKSLSIPGVMYGVCYFGCAKTITSAWHNRFLGMKRSLHRHETLVGLFLLVFRADDVPQFHLVADLLFCDPSQASGDFGAVLFHTEQIGGGDVRSIDFYILY